MYCTHSFGQIIISHAHLHPIYLTLTLPPPAHDDCRRCPISPTMYYFILQITPMADIAKIANGTITAAQ
eukprot:scaffold16290_cov189-Skeletonema_menzelii.AAC.3